MSTQQQMPSWDQVRAAIGRMARERSEWAGMPLPVKGLSMTIHPSYPFAENLSKTFMPEPSTHVCHEEDINEDVEHRNTWRSYRDGREVTIWREGKKFFIAFAGRQNAAPMLLHTLGAAQSWSFEAEITAMETLRKHISDWAFQCYVMTGMFLESSPRSHVTYLFRRLRPTLALTGQPDKKGRDVGMRILCALCLHPVGYFSDSWAGALTPTDDVLAHLLLMRSDEHKYWANANQHHPMAPEAGL